MNITAYNANNQLTTWGTANLFYDANGNMTSDGTHSFTWDARNRLSAIDNGNTASFAYDPFGRRVTRTAGGTSTSFLYDAMNIVNATTSTGTVTMLTGDVDEYFQYNNASSYGSFLTDASGSTLALADPSGTLATQCKAPH